jgi:hypothetical protein
MLEMFLTLRAREQISDAATFDFVVNGCCGIEHLTGVFIEGLDLSTMHETIMITGLREDNIECYHNDERDACRDGETVQTKLRAVFLGNNNNNSRHLPDIKNIFGERVPILLESDANAIKDWLEDKITGNEVVTNRCSDGNVSSASVVG